MNFLVDVKEHRIHLKTVYLKLNSKVPYAVAGSYMFDDLVKEEDAETVKSFAVGLQALFKNAYVRIGELHVLGESFSNQKKLREFLTMVRRDFPLIHTVTLDTLGQTELEDETIKCLKETKTPFVGTEQKVRVQINAIHFLPSPVKFPEGVEVEQRDLISWRGVILDKETQDPLKNPWRWIDSEFYLRDKKLFHRIEAGELFRWNEAFPKSTITLISHCQNPYCDYLDLEKAITFDKVVSFLNANFGSSFIRHIGELKEIPIKEGKGTMSEYLK